MCACVWSLCFAFEQVINALVCVPTFVFTLGSVCVCVRVFVCVRERERDRERNGAYTGNSELVLRCGICLFD